MKTRPVASDAVDNVVREIVRQLRSVNEREVPSRLIGEWVMTELKRLDQVAYVRFASVYRRFEDVQAFREEIERLERDLPELEGLQLPLLGEAVKSMQKKKH
jgi:transcriptional repressor NrdR